MKIIVCCSASTADYGKCVKRMFESDPNIESILIRVDDEDGFSYKEKYFSEIDGAHLVIFLKDTNDVMNIGVSYLMSYCMHVCYQFLVIDTDYVSKNKEFMMTDLPVKNEECCEYCDYCDI